MGIVLQSQRLLQEAQGSATSLGKQVAVLETLTALSTVISIARDENQLLLQSAQALVTALGVDYCQIHMLDLVENVGRLVCEYPHQGRVGTVIEPDEMPLKEVPTADRPGPVVINQVATSELLREERRAHLMAQKIEALMMLPLFARGRMIGAIWLQIHREGQSFSPEMVEIAQTIMSQVVVGLQNLRLLAEAQRRSEQLQRVSDLAQTIQANLDLEIVLRTALTESQAIVPIEQMKIALYDQEQRTLRQAAHYLDGRNQITVFNGPELPMGGTLMGEVWETQQSVHIADVSQQEITDTDAPAGSLLITPLRARGSGLGVVSVGHSQPHIYTETDVIVFQQMIGQLAAAVENATVYEHTQRQARNEALVNDISSRLQQQVELEEMIKLVVNDLGDALGARRARIRLGTGKQEG
jgi:GAF domain-containing protein